MKQHSSVAGAVLLVVLAACAARAQELTPGAYTPIPINVNFVGVSNSLSHGDITFDPALPIEDANATIDTTIFTAGRSLNALGRMANIVIAIPLATGRVEGRYLGVDQRVDRTGLADSQVRFGINLYGAPALTLTDFIRQKRRTVLGASLTTAWPLGQYDSSKVINLGNHRWAFKPELGISRTVGHWTFEGYAGVWLFTDNDDFTNGHLRSQKPLTSLQFHVEYQFHPRLWVAFNSNFYSGGRTSIDGVKNFDFQKNSRVGGTLSVPVGQRHAIKAALSKGALTTIGADFFSASAAYQYTWGGGL
jgi:hypothetical protein